VIRRPYSSCSFDTSTVTVCIVLRESGTLCGGVGLRIEPDHRRAELGYWIGFGTLRLHRIFVSHFANNPTSARVLRKIGMHHEGSLRAHVLKWGEFLDLEKYGMVVSDVDRSTA
jgi:[ribosomal protein S5]-alanine N-acetyltransferase